MCSKKGQYFSFDAIIASVIFMLAMTLLLGQWFSIRQVTDMSSEFLQDDALKASDIFLSHGTPDDWYDPAKLTDLSGTRSAGFALKGRPNHWLDNNAMDAINYFWYPDYWQDANNDPTQYYNSYRTLMGVGSHMYVGAFTMDWSSGYWLFGYPWAYDDGTANEYVVVRRLAAVNDSNNRPVPAMVMVVLYSGKG